MNRIDLVGNLTVDPTTRVVEFEGVPTNVTNFSIAVNEKGKKEPVYFRCHAWRGLADTCYKYLKKGRKVFISGPVKLKSYQDSSGAIRYAMDVRVDYIDFLDPNPDKKNNEPDELETLTEEDLPFTS